MKPDLPVEVGDTELRDELAHEMALVEEELLASVATENDMLAATARHLILAGGKRLRPFIVLLASRFGDRRDPRVVSAAAVVELTHIGSLYHDDVMDEALIRRGVPSAHTIWGNSVAVLTGDFLFARAARLISGLGPEAIQVHAKAFSRLAEGQSAETVGPDAEADPLGHHMDVLGGKTASLFAASAEIGSLLAEAPPATTASLARACEAWGLAFQLADDVLDITSDSARSGKPVGTDLREGVPTLPALYVLKSSSPSDARLIDLLSSGQLTDPDLHSEALELLRKHPAVDMARDEVRRWANLAKYEIRSLPTSPAREAFEALCNVVVDKIL